MLSSANKRPPPKAAARQTRHRAPASLPSLCQLLMAGTKTSAEAQELRGDIESSTTAIDEQKRLVATLLKRALELRDILHRLVVYFLNDVAAA